MALSPKMQKFVERLPLTGSVKPAWTREEFESRIDSEDDDFIDEYLRSFPNGYRREYVEETQRIRERHKTLFWAKLAGVAAVFGVVLVLFQIFQSFCTSDKSARAPKLLDTSPPAAASVPVISTPTPTNQSAPKP
jgi:hypothetical protein